MQTKIKFLEEKDQLVLKVIEITEKTHFGFFNGYIYYSRKFNEGEITTKNDYIDDFIFKSVKERYDNSKLKNNQHIYFEGQLESILAPIKQLQPIESNISIIPQITIEEYKALKEKEKEELYSYSIECDFRVNPIYFEKEYLKCVISRFQAQITYGELFEFNKIYEHIKFKF